MRPLSTAGVGAGTNLATAPPEANKPRQGHGPFDTFRFVEELENAGVPRGQAVIIMEQTLLAISEANTRQTSLVATKEDLLNLQSGISEKVFSATLRYDLAQRHLKELMQKDLMQAKADVRQEEKFDYAKLHDEITELEKRVFQRRETDEVRFTQVHTEIAALERRVILQYGIGFFGSVLALGLAVARIAL